jgi:uncharacterized membrane protein YqiK
MKAAKRLADAQKTQADTIIGTDARAARLREKLLEPLEGIVRENVTPMEKIEGINILHVDGVNGGNGGTLMPPTR